MNNEADGSDTVAEVPQPDSSDHGARKVLSYLLYGEVDEYVAIMDVLESSVNDMRPAEVARALAETGRPLDPVVVESRLDTLRGWGVLHATTDTSRIRRHADLLARNWRYTPTPLGRQVHRFYRTVLVGTPVMREIPLAGLNGVVRSLEALAAGAGSTAEHVRTVFVNHDDLDGALVGAEDTLSALADRYDLDDDATAELRGLLVDYATRVATELADGSALACKLLDALRPRFDELAGAAVAASDAHTLIERGALMASHGGRVEDWEGLCAWFDPASGRAQRFVMRLVGALPGMHANLRRLHTSAGAATSRSRALSLAAACANPELGRQIALAALGDHSWRKLSGETDDTDLSRVPSWTAGPKVQVPELLRLTGRGGARGRHPAARSDQSARDEVQARRRRRMAEHTAALKEILAAGTGQPLSEQAARVALEALMAAARRQPAAGARRAVKDGLACTLFRLDGHSGPVLAAPTWSIFAPGRVAVFHHPDVQAAAPPQTAEDTDTDVALNMEGVA